MNFHIGQEVVCVVAGGELVEGTVYKILGLQSSRCFCNEVEVNVGHLSKHEGMPCFCTRCYAPEVIGGKYAWYGDFRFKPLDTLCDISELTEILTETKPFEV
jgi:hypothetical protein